MTEELLKRLEDTNSKAHEVGYGDPVNPDGPEAAALIRQLKAENEELACVRNAILSAGNSRIVFGKVKFGVWSLDKLGTAFDRAAQSLNQTERGEG